MTRLLTLVLLLLPATTGQDAIADQRLEDNAALWYWRAIHASRELSSDIEMQAAAYLDDRDDHDARRAVKHHVGALWPQLETAAAMPVCVFGVDWDEGWNATLPHLSPMMQWALVLRADAVACANQNDHDTAAMRLAILLAMADHLAQEPALPSLLSASRIIRDGHRIMERIDVEALSMDARVKVRTALARVNDIDAQRLGEVLAAESRRARIYAQQRWSGEGGEQRMREDIRMITTWPAHESVEPGDYDALDAQYERWEAVDERIAEALRRRDRTQLDELVRTVAAGEHGWVARAFISRLDRTFDTVADAKARVTEMRDQLRE